MSTDVDTGLDELLLLDLELGMDEVLPCENKHHDHMPSIHDGPGKWYVKSECPECGEDASMDGGGKVFLVCDKFYLYLKSISMTLGHVCGCKQPLGAYVKTLGRRD